MCTVLLPTGVNPTAVNKYVINICRNVVMAYLKSNITTLAKGFGEDYS